MSERRKYELSMKFIDRLAHCETHSNWKDRGNWSGGLGIARSTWIAFGGIGLLLHVCRANDSSTQTGNSLIAVQPITSRMASAWVSRVATD